MSSYKLHCDFTLCSNIVLAAGTFSIIRSKETEYCTSDICWSMVSCNDANGGDGLLCELDLSGTSIVAM